jgi:hypothetical protein
MKFTTHFSSTLSSATSSADDCDETVKPINKINRITLISLLYEFFEIYQRVFDALLFYENYPDASRQLITLSQKGKPCEDISTRHYYCLKRVIEE